MRGTLTTALLLAASSQIAAKSNQVKTHHLSHQVVKTPDKMNTKASSRRFLLNHRKQRVDLALTAADESRTIEKAVPSAVHSITDSSGALGATRDAVREMLDLNAFPKEVIRSEIDLNFPPSEPSALLTEASNIPQRNHASTSTASEIAVSSSRTSNQRTAKTLANLDMSHKAMTPISISKKRFKKPAALRATRSKKSIRNDLLTAIVDPIYTMYLEHLKTKALGLDPTEKETKALLNMYIESTVSPLSVSQTLSNLMRKMKVEDMNLFTTKLGTNVISTLSSLASLKVPPESLKQIQRPLVWYASLVRWRAMYREFIKFFMDKSDEITKSLPDVEFPGRGRSVAVNAVLLAELEKDMRLAARDWRIAQLAKESQRIMAKSGLEKETAAAVQKAIEQFLENEYQLLSAPLAASHT
uniref:Putative RxLR effector n=1 Tax=Plasmopara viticola TaxID=143451 RepID=A0A650F644_PLAVT|nr:putative RxLR effector [Plasmopara viticola]